MCYTNNPLTLRTLYYCVLYQKLCTVLSFKHIRPGHTYTHTCMLTYARTHACTDRQRVDRHSCTPAHTYTHILYKPSIYRQMYIKVDYLYTVQCITYSFDPGRNVHLKVQSTHPSITRTLDSEFLIVKTRKHTYIRKKHT